MAPASYRAAARKLRKIADALDARCEPQSPSDKAALTSAVHRLTHTARALSARHHGRPIYGPSEP
jgi:hypothetical protein